MLALVPVSKLDYFYLYKMKNDTCSPFQGGSAFVLGELFPQADVMGVDLAPPYVRFSRAFKSVRNATNVEFYQANAEDLSFIESDSIDFVNFAYVLHEMPEINSKRIVDEMFRILKPGGIINGFDAPYVRNPILRAYFVSSNSWDEDWHNQVEFS